MISKVFEQLAVLDQAGFEPDAIIVVERRDATILSLFSFAHRVQRTARTPARSAAGHGRQDVAASSQREAEVGQLDRSIDDGTGERRETSATAWWLSR
jgi:hypothetical protein